jgi:hypothetical protein
MAPAATTSAAATGGEVMFEAVVLQRVELARDLENHVPAAAAIATVGSAARHELLTAEAQGTRTTVAAFDKDLDAVREHQDPARPGDLCATGLNGFRENGDFLAPVTGPLEADDAIDEREQGMIAPHADIGPGKDRRAALAKNDGAGVDRLARTGLQAQPLTDAVASVP